LGEGWDEGLKERPMEMLKTLARKKSYLIWLTVLVALGIALKITLFAPPLVKTVKIERRDLTAQVYGNGTVEAKVIVGISSKITGRIVELYADQGDRVKRGQLLAKLENDDVLHQQRQSEAGLNRSAAGLSVEKANLHKAQATLALAEKNALRFRTLAEKNLVSKLEAEQYDTSCQVAREEVARCRAALDAATMEQRASRAGLGFARSKVADTLIYAPQDGVIITRDLEKGGTVTPGVPIFTLADPETVWVKANVDESLLKGVAVGNKAVIALRSSPNEPFPGQVARLGHQSDRVTEELEVDVAFTPPLKNFRLGEQSDVYIIAGMKKDALSLPSGAMVTKDKKRGVWIVADGKLAFKEVTIGIVDRRNFAEIVTGLAGGVRVAVAPPPEMARFKEGMKVRATP
jgi:HlyD family secretion protein